MRSLAIRKTNYRNAITAFIGAMPYHSACAPSNRFVLVAITLDE